MANKSNRMEPKWISDSDDESDIKEEVIEIGEESIHTVPDKPGWSPLGSPVFSRSGLKDAIPIYEAHEKRTYEIINGTMVVNNGPPYEILDDSWNFVTGDKEAILNRGSSSIFVKKNDASGMLGEKKGNGSTTMVAEKKSNDDGGNGSAAAATAEMASGNKKAETKPKNKPRPKFPISGYTNNCFLCFCFQIMAFILILCLVYVPLHYNLAGWPQGPGTGKIMYRGIDTNEKKQLERDVEMALTADKTAAQDQFEWELDNSPGIPIEHLDHREYQVGNRHFIDHAHFPM